MNTQWQWRGSRTKFALSNFAAALLVFSASAGLVVVAFGSGVFASITVLTLFCLMSFAWALVAGTEVVLIHKSFVSISNKTMSFRRYWKKESLLLENIAYIYFTLDNDIEIVQKSNRSIHLRFELPMDLPTKLEMLSVLEKAGVTVFQSKSLAGKN
jgi:hypothetical protein